jgi:polyhydroxybutyrate depolymerase
VPGTGGPCQKPIQPDFSKLITTNGRTYLVAGCLDTAPATGFPVVLAFHGGGEAVHTASDEGLADYSGLSSLSAVVVFINGQFSGNGQTWNAAFPWMVAPTPQDDAALVETILGDLANQVPKGTSLDMTRIYTVGKSDGAGMATKLLCTNAGKFKLTAAASISGAHFGLDSVTNFGTSLAQICLPKAAVPVLFVHGTGDTVMPYQGQNFVTAKALESSQKFWVTIDKAVTTTASKTYTASMKDYVQAWATQANGCGANPTNSTFSSASTLTLYSDCTAPIAAITVANGEHVWPGHAKSGPKSGQAPNMDFDVTPVIAAFFNIDASRYTPTQSVPTGALNTLPNYKSAPIGTPTWLLPKTLVPSLLPTTPAPVVPKTLVPSLLPTTPAPVVPKTLVPSVLPTATPTATPTAWPWLATATPTLMTLSPDAPKTPSPVSLAALLFTMAGSLGDFTPTVLDSIKSSLATAAGISAALVSVEVQSGARRRSVVLKATMPSGAATSVMAQVQSGTLKQLGGLTVEGVAVGTVSTSAPTTVVGFGSNAPITTTAPVPKTPVPTGPPSPPTQPPTQFPTSVLT